MSRKISFIVLAIFLLPRAVSADEQLLDDLFGPYRNRSDTVTPGAGNAKDTNAATHVVDPWPPKVGVRHLTADGKRMVGAVQRYREGPDTQAPNATPNAPALPLPTGLLPGNIGHDIAAAATAQK